jgi:7-carboxy-7-deazaguanine synthase
MKYVPINVDRNVSKKDYPKPGSNQLLVSSIFETVQGEGPYAGHPAIFVRLAGCNIGDKKICGFCDTKFDFDKGVLHTTQELQSKISGIRQSNGTSLVVVTGGEPLLQEANLRSFLQTPGFEFQIETNGYFVKSSLFGTEIDKSETDEEPAYAQNPMHQQPYLVVSPKAKPSGYGKWVQGWSDYNDAFTQYRQEKLCLKYVLTSDETSVYHVVPLEHLKRAKEEGITVYVSGMAVYKKSYPDGRTSSIWNADEIDQEATARNYRYVADYAIKHGLLVSLQTHLFLSVE